VLVGHVFNQGGHGCRRVAEGAGGIWFDDRVTFRGWTSLRQSPSAGALEEPLDLGRHGGKTGGCSEMRAIGGSLKCTIPASCPGSDGTTALGDRATIVGLRKAPTPAIVGESCESLTCSSTSYGQARGAPHWHRHQPVCTQQSWPVLGKRSWPAVLSRSSFAISPVAGASMLEEPAAASRMCGGAAGGSPSFRDLTLRPAPFWWRETEPRFARGSCGPDGRGSCVCKSEAPARFWAFAVRGP